MAKEKSPFGTTVAHGLLTLSLSPKFLEALLKIESAKMGVNYGTNKVRFTSPVPSGSRMRMKATLKSVEEIANNGARLLFDTVFEIEGAKKPACVAELISVIYE
jgi:acyl dehydratase